jgi:hypothetical protein
MIEIQHTAHPFTALNQSGWVTRPRGVQPSIKKTGGGYHVPMGFQERSLGRPLASLGRGFNAMALRVAL